MNALEYFDEMSLEQMVEWFNTNIRGYGEIVSTDHHKEWARVVRRLGLEVFLQACDEAGIEGDNIPEYILVDYEDETFVAINDTSDILRSHEKSMIEAYERNDEQRDYYYEDR